MQNKAFSVLIRFTYSDSKLLASWTAD